MSYSFSATMAAIKLVVLLTVISGLASAKIDADLGLDLVIGGDLDLELGHLFKNNTYSYGGVTVTPEELVDANDKCMIQNNLCPTEKDQFQYENFPPGEVPDAILCTIKCANEQLGLLKKNGELDLVKLFFGSPYFPDKYKLINCIKSIGKINTCQDISKNIECLKKYNVPKPAGVL